MVLDILLFTIGIGIAGITIIALHTQIKKQSKTTSSDVLLKTLERVREPDFQDTIRKILADQSEECEDIEIRKLLNYFEYVAVFEDDGVLELNHIIQMHGAVLRKIRNDEYVQNMINNLVNDNPKLYTYLRRLLGAI